LKRLFLHPCFTVGYGSKDHSPLPYYGLVAAAYGDGRPVRMAYDRFEHFQAGLKRHQFSMRYRIGVERKTGLMQAFQADIVSNGGGRANCSDALTMVAATSAASIYYFPKTDVAATAMSSRALDCGSARGYGALETLAATEIMADEIAGELGLDPIEFRLRNVLRTGMKNAQGAVPDGQQRAETVLQKAAAHALWTGRAARKQAYDAANPGKSYGVGFGCIQRRFGDGAQCSLAKVELSADGHVTLGHTGTEIGTGTSSGQAVACARWLGRPADVLEMAVTDWPELPVETSGDPHAMAQDEQDRLAKNPRWVPAFASASSASNSAYYFTHATQAAARVVFLHGLLPAAVAIWGREVKPEAARWRDGALTAEGLEPLPLARLASHAHGRGLVTGATVHVFNRWQWAEAEFEIGGAVVRLPVDALSLRQGDAKAWRVLDRRAVFFPPTANNNTMVGYNTCVGTLVEIAVDAASGKVAVLNHHTILECGNMLVPDLVSGQMQGCLASGIGLALHEEMPLYEDGPGNGTWNFNRYYLPRGSDVAVWQQTAEVLPPLSDSEPPKGMAEVVMIPIVPALLNAIHDATGSRFAALPVTQAMLKRALA
jgi:CO/xanthine dehydrogenase Mo-binding subunit